MQTKTLYTVVDWIAFPSFVKRECTEHMLPRERRGCERCGRELGWFRFKYAAVRQILGTDTVTAGYSGEHTR